jgi:2-keto-3-deoxy-L-rhamnonate aldolase RhmA
MAKDSDPAAPWQNPLFTEQGGWAHMQRSLLLGNGLREKAREGWALGTFLIEQPVPATLGALSLAGFDFVVLDMEHSSVDFGTLGVLIGAGQAAGLATLVRVWGEDIGLIGKVLEMGAHGIMAPHVDTPERARAIVDQARFPPAGHRSFSPLTRYDALREPLRQLGEATYVVVQIEGREALDRAAAIASVPGLDAVFVGPYDLALSLGVTPGSEKVYDAAQQVADAVAAGVTAGIYIDDPSHCGAWAARGFALQCVGFDGRMLSSGARAIVDQARVGMKKKKS